MERYLVRGIAGTESTAVREDLGASPDAEDRDVAHALVTSVAEADIARIGSQLETRADPREPDAVPPEDSADSSFLGRLSVSDDVFLSVGRIDDVSTLLAILRAGSLRQRRAALERITDRLSDRKAMEGDAIRESVEMITQLRDVELACELAHARAHLPGAPGRKARAEREEWRKLVTTIEGPIVAFWDGQLHAEPIGRLPGDQRAQLLLHARDLPDLVAQHLSAIIEGSDGVTTAEGRVGLLASLRYAGDRRLVPALASVLENAHGELAAEAARVLGGIEDPRVQPILCRHFERAVVDDERAVLAGALGMAGDARGADRVRELLFRDHPLVVMEALEALEGLGTSEDGELVAQFLTHGDLAVATQAVRTLGRIGDGRVLDDLSDLYADTQIPALRATIEDALAAIAARMELRGEEAATIDWSEVGNKPALREGPNDRLGYRVLGWRDYLVGQLWLLLGTVDWAIARFEAAAAHRSGWATPLVAIAMAFAARGHDALALPAFRRATAVDRHRIERNPKVVRAMARCFLRRAEQMEREGREDIARGLVGEVLTLDLRRAPSALRFELQRLDDLLRREEQEHAQSVA